MPAAPWCPDRGDVIMIDFHPQAGTEMPDRHPMLVLSPVAFNARTGVVIGLPMTHSARHETNPFAVRWVGAGNEVAYVVTDQPKSFDWRARNAKAHSWKRAPAKILNDACESLNQIIALA